MTLISEPKEEIEKELTKVYNSFMDPVSWGSGEDFTKDLLTKWKVSQDEMINPLLGGAYGAFTYGEITFTGVEKFLHKFHEKFNKDAVFYDLGSGFGKVANHIALRTTVKKSIGVEYDQYRVEKSRQLIEKVEFHSTIPEIIHGDIFDQDYSDATIVYFDNTAYSVDFLKKVIEDLLPKGCLFLYQYYGWMTGDSFIRTETTYSPKFNEASDMENLPVRQWWYSNCSYRIIGE